MPRLLSIQTDPAEFETSEAVADAIERAAEALLRWHDELAEIRTSPIAPAPRDADPVLVEHAGGRPVHASPRLAERIRAGVIPADCASLEFAASELHSIAESIRRAAAQCAEPSTGTRGELIADALDRLSTALRTLADTLRGETRRLADDVAGGADQVLARVVRAEHAARLVAATTLPGR